MSPGLDILLQYAQKQSGNAAIARDLDQIIAPWIGTRSMNGRDPSEDTITATWQDVFNWLLTASQNDFQFAAKAILEWEGPPDATHDGLLRLLPDCSSRVVRKSTSLVRNTATVTAGPTKSF